MKFSRPSFVSSLLFVLFCAWLPLSVRGQRGEDTAEPTETPPDSATEPPEEGAPPFPKTADELIRYLNNTIWVDGGEPGYILTVNKDGDVSEMDGGQTALEFVGYNDALVMKVYWWIGATNTSYTDYSVASPVGEGELAYVEANGHPDAFPGIIGAGSIKMRQGDDGSVIMVMSQLGRRTDGSASTFTAQLVQADAVPDYSTSQTYPSLDGPTEDGEIEQTGGGAGGGETGPPPSNQGNNIPFSTSSATSFFVEYLASRVPLVGAVFVLFVAGIFL